MHGNLPALRAGAIYSTPDCGTQPVPEPGPNPGSGTDDGDDWFAATAFAVFGTKEAGLHLHMATGWPRTSCYAFVARDPTQRRKPPIQFLRKLFHSEHGAPFFAAFMHGCKSQWWLDVERARRIAEAIAHVE